MARLYDVARAAAERMGAWADCRSDVHGGAWTEREIDRLSSATPAIYVALSQADRNTSMGEEAYDPETDAGLRRSRRSVRAAYVAAILTRDRDRDRRDDSSDQIAEAIGTMLLELTPDEQWGMGGVGGATDVDLQNAFSSSLARKRVAFWTVSWRHDVVLGEPGPDGPAPVRLCITPRLLGVADPAFDPRTGEPC